MGLMPRTLTALIANATPEGWAKMSKDCKRTADKFQEASVLLTEAAKAYADSDFSTGLQMLKHTQERLDRKD